MVFNNRINWTDAMAWPQYRILKKRRTRQFNHQRNSAIQSGYRTHLFLAASAGVGKTRKSDRSMASAVFAKLWMIVGLVIIACAAAPGAHAAQPAGAAATQIRPATAAREAQSPAAMVDPFVGTGVSPGGTINLFPGVSMPFGMVQLSPDTDYPGIGHYQYYEKFIHLKGRNIGVWSVRGLGYHYYQRFIQGFSMTHMSGAGCPNEGDVFFTATTGTIHTQINNFKSGYLHSRESASPGYYSVWLKRWHIDAQLTATDHCGLAQFTFPAGKQANILIPISHTLNDTAASGLQIVNRHEISGYVVNHCFCGNQQTYKVYFVMRFSQSAGTWGTWNGRNGKGTPIRGSHAVTQTQHDQWVGAYVSWPAEPQPRTITARIGISYVDLAGAKNNLKQETTGRTFQTIRRKALGIWNHDLSVIRITGGTSTNRKIFYTALYHCMLMPSMFSDADGRYLGFDGKIHRVSPPHHVYCNFSGWDVYRSEMPLLAIIAPQRMQDMCRSIVLMCRQGGWIGRWPQINHYTNVMCGSPLTTVLCTAYLDGLHGFDIHAAWRAMFTDATKAPPAGHPYAGESNIRWINKLHYDPDNLEGYGSVSQIQEDCVAYASLYDLAKALGKSRDAEILYKRALYYRNVFDPVDHHFRPRLANGRWRKPFALSQSHGFIEGSAAQYQWLAPCDVAWLVQAVGKARFNHRLAGFFDNKSPVLLPDYYNPCNEYDLQAPFEFNFSGKPWKTQAIVRRVLKQYYRLSVNGIPGNDDCGEMSSWAVMTMMGLYAVDPASRAYELCSPMFPRIDIHLKAPYTGRNFMIKTTVHPALTPFIQKVQFNGHDQKRNWINVADITRGGVLSFTLARTADRNWGAAAADAPPSISDNAPLR